MDFFRYRIRFKSALHLGAGREDDLGDVEELPSSDTIAAALLSLWKHVNGGDIAPLAANPPFAVSSALPEDDKGQLLWPAPRVLLERAAASAGKALGDSRKRVKRIRWVSETELRALAEKLELPQLHVTRWQETSRRRLEVDRFSGGPIEGRLYEFGSVEFNSGTALSILATFRDKSWREPFEAALRLLGDQGLGGDRSCGYGAFTVEEAGRFKAPSLGSGARLLLSLYHPTAEEVRSGVLDPPASYELVMRGGWVTAPGGNTLRRRVVAMLAEGSLIRDTGSSWYGGSPVVLSTSDANGLLTHDVHRPGLAVTLAVKLPEEDHQ